MKLTFEQVNKKLLSIGFNLMPSEEEEGVIVLGTYGLNYCPWCQRHNGSISIFCYPEDHELCISGANEMGSWNDPLTKGTLQWTLRELGVKSKDCKINLKTSGGYGCGPEMVNYGEEGLEDSQEL